MLLLLDIELLLFVRPVFEFWLFPLVMFPGVIFVTFAGIVGFTFVSELVT